MSVSEYVNHPASMAAPGTVLAFKLFGLTLGDWTTVGAFVLIVLQLYVLIRDKLYRPWKERRDGSKRS